MKHQNKLKRKLKTHVNREASIKNIGWEGGIIKEVPEETSKSKKIFSKRQKTEIEDDR